MAPSDGLPLRWPRSLMMISHTLSLFYTSGSQACWKRAVQAVFPFYSWPRRHLRCSSDWEWFSSLIYVFIPRTALSVDPTEHSHLRGKHVPVLKRLPLSVLEHVRRAGFCELHTVGYTMLIRPLSPRPHLSSDM